MRTFIARIGLIGMTALGLADFAPAAEVGSSPLREASTPAKTVATSLPSTHLHNLFRASTNVFSGSSPETDAAFAEIAQLGVKTVISVDGSKPNVEAARRQGLRYVHLPLGYDGVPARRVAELTKAARSLGGPLYVHCHHGMHRGPAAVAVICQAIGVWTQDEATLWLGQAGTSPDYPGLFRAASGFRPPRTEEVARVADLPEITPSSSLVESMVALDVEFDRVEAARKNGWSKLPEQPDILPPHTSTILLEQLRELGRTDDTAKRSGDYREKLAESSRAAEALDATLRDPQSDFAMRDAAFQGLARTCAACHKQFRN